MTGTWYPETLARSLRLVLCASIALVPMGCETGGMSGIDRSDACGAEHADFVNAKGYYSEAIVKGAIGGALGGAALGALGAAVTGGNVGKGAAIGAGTGALAGASAAYYNAVSQDNADRAALSKTVYGDVARSNQELDHTSTSFAKLRACRFATAARIKADMKSGTLTRDQAQTQLADQKRRFDEEIAIARQLGTKMEERNEQYRFASDQLIKDDSDAKSQVDKIKSQGTQAKSGSDYSVLVTVNLRPEPSTAKPAIKALFPGTIVHLASPLKEGDAWARVSTDDGAGGYVTRGAIGPVGSAPVQQTAKWIDPPPDAKPSVQAAVLTTETIPQKRAAYGSDVDSASSQSQTAFNLDQTNPNG
jgi:hypothetical protein